MLWVCPCVDSLVPERNRMYLVNTIGYLPICACLQIGDISLSGNLRDGEASQ